MIDRRHDGIWRSDRNEVDVGAVAEWRTSQRREQDGELSLLRAVMADAIARAKRGDIEARDWICGEPDEPVVRFTFWWICEHLELDPDQLRRLLPTAKSRRRREAPRPSRTRIVVRGPGEGG